jgi:hypothetical protein
LNPSDKSRFCTTDLTPSAPLLASRQTLRRRRPPIGDGSQTPLQFRFGQPSLQSLLELEDEEDVLDRVLLEINM